MATRTLTRASVARDVPRESTVLVAATGDRIARVVLDLALADLRDPTHTWTAEVWESLDGVAWAMAARITDVGLAGRLTGSSYVELQDTSMPGRQYRARITMTSRTASIGATLEVAAVRSI